MSNFSNTTVAPSFRIDQILHPNFLSAKTDFEKWRSTFEGGRQFIDRYLVRYSTRETTDDFNSRKRITYVPAHAKAAIIDIRNAIFQRMTDIVRTGGPKSYKASVQGENRGVDLKGNSMNSFLGRFILQELLVLGRVGIYVDRPEIPARTTLADSVPQPYLYYYEAEDIRSWHYNEAGELDAILVQDHFFNVDSATGLVNGSDAKYRLMALTETGQVSVRFFKHDRIRLETVELTEEQKILDLQQIPFVLLELTNSLLSDVADIQIALMNLASSDMNYALKSNYPFYTEMFSPTSLLAHNRPGDQAGTSVEASEAKALTLNTGPMTGRRYPKGLERPGFIHPSSEPLLASMEKQDRLIVELRQLVNLALTNTKPVRASAESKQIDNQGLEAGLSYIGLELEYAEREIAKIWSDYTGDSEVAYIKYPDNYELRTDKERRSEAAELEKLKPGVPSITYKKELCKQIARVTVGAKIPLETMTKITSEIESASVVETSAEIVRSDHEAGFVSTDTASKIRGYEAGEAEQAKKDHVERLANIAAAQSPGGLPSKMPDASSGVSDLGHANDATQQKQVSRQVDQQPTTTSRVRGNAAGGSNA